MLVSLLKKSKSLFGIGSVVRSIEPPLDNSRISEHNGQICVDGDYLSTDSDELKDSIYDLIRTIRDPEKPATLEDLNVVYDEGIIIEPATPESACAVVRIEFNPTVPHCSLATLIGLCIRIKLLRHVDKFKLDIFIKKGTHSTEDEINKQINDKERIAAAMENPNLCKLVEDCIREGE